MASIEDYAKAAEQASQAEQSANLAANEYYFQIAKDIFGLSLDYQEDNRPEYNEDVMREFTDRQSWVTMWCDYHIAGDDYPDDEIMNMDNYIEQMTEPTSPLNLNSVTLANKAQAYISACQLYYGAIKTKQQVSDELLEEIDNSDPEPHIEVEDQTGHIFPVTACGQAINKMIDYNNMMSSLIQDAKYYEQCIDKAIRKGPGKMNVSWVAKIVEKICKRINYWLAWLRYFIIKGLSGIYKAANKVLETISPVVQGLLNLLDLLGGLSLDSIISAVSNIINAIVNFARLLYKPIEVITTFIQDVTTYVPKLTEQAQNLQDNVSGAVDYTMSLKDKINEYVGDIQNADLSPEVLEKYAEKYTDIDKVSFKIKFEPITLDMIVNPSSVQKPRWEDYK